MQKTTITQKIYDCGVMAIVRVDTLNRAEEIVNGCLKGSVNVLEISYTNSNASDVIAYIKNKYQDQVVIGAGTVLDEQTARIAILSGAQFIIAPNFNKEVAKLCNRYQIPYAPGCSTYSEMIEALEYGSAFVKVFPVANYFGPDFVKVLKTPLPQMPILASGGVTLENAHIWFKNKVDCVGVGTLLTKGSEEEIACNAMALTKIMKENR